MEATGDQAVRRQALSFEASCIVQAPAGSGKTELLIQRYLNLLAGVQEPEEIVAITFTRKAAGEMRERILAALRHAAAGGTGARAVDAARIDLARRAIENDRRRGWQLTDHPARLQIQTIDALCLSLTRQLPYLSGFAAPSGILEDAGAAYQRAAVDAIRLLGGRDEAWRDAVRRFLVHLDNDVSLAAGMLAAMLGSRDQWLRHVGDAGDAGQIELAWREVIEGVLARARASFPEELQSRIVGCADAAAANLAREGREPGAGCWSGDGFPEPLIEELPRWRFLANMLLTRSGSWRKQVDRKVGFEPGSEAKTVMQELLADLSVREELAGALNAAGSLPGGRLDDEQAGILNAMATVLKLAVAQLQLIFEETGQVDFVEVTRRAIAALGALEAPTDLALKLDYQIRHLLVDEFQDTSVAQYQLLQLLTQGWTPGDGRTLFLVGDPMQSVYRFREAEVSVFLKVWREGLGSVPLTPLTLSSNFRSSPAVVDWVNRTFSACFPPSSDVQSGAVSYTPATPGREEAGGAGVYVHPCLDCPESEQAERLAELVAQALERSADVAVLVRARSHLAGLLPSLERRGIPYSGVDVKALINEPVVRDLYSLTRALRHPGDRMAWLSLLRAPWCGLALEDLLAVAASGRRSIWSSLREAEPRSRLSADGLDRVDRLLAALDGAMSQRGRLTLRQWVRRAWTELGGPALSGDAQLAHARAYFELLGRHQAGMDLVDDRAFAAALQGHWAQAEPGSGAVQLMTIHRAKGLEFDEVFLPALDRSTRSDDKPLLLWEEVSEGGGLLLAVPSARGAAEDEHYRFLRTLQARKSDNETDRLLYVACTRARERVHLAANLSTRDGEVAKPARGSLLHRIWAGVESRFQAVEPGSQDGGQAGGYRPAGGEGLKRLPAGWEPPPVPVSVKAAEAAAVEERRVEFAWAGETARQVGILVHELMQGVAAEGIGHWNEKRIESLLPAWRDRLEHLGVAPRELDAAVRRAADSIRNVLDDERAAWLLRPDHVQAENEYELSVRIGDRVRRLRIDRTFIDERGVRWIIDYKTSAHEGGAPEAFLDEEVRRYQGQMELYAGAMRRMEDRGIKLGLYFPLLKAWREWPYSE